MRLLPEWRKPEGGSTRVVVVGTDAEDGGLVPFKLIKRVMFSCTTAGFNNINFAVLNGTAKQNSGSATASAGQP